MEFDVFFSICQTEVHGYLPDERTMFRNFFEQVELADRLGCGTAWVAESHLSTEVQKTNPGAVIPHFVGEIGLNTDILQLAHRVFARTKRIGVGSAIMNILCNGGPIAHAERIKTFLALHGLEPEEKRLLTIGFAAGRFPFINVPYGIVPRDPVEAAAWPVVKNKIFEEATEIFLRLLRGETLSSSMIARRTLKRSDFRKDEEWQRVQEAHGSYKDEIALEPRWTFPNLKIVPRESRMDLLRLSIGSHDPATQLFANTLLPVGVFNLSITPGDEIEKTNERMQTGYHPDGGGWQRRLMPRTVLVFYNEDPAQAAEEARDALSNYWRALEGTLDEEKVRRATNNALIGDAEAIARQMGDRFHPDDRLMLWFDFNNHDSKRVMANMEAFLTLVAPQFR
ncbi:MAG TPA: LLM class flavin-dependent oxidoreductase [Thermoanaerobaculia bacterium]|jgi:alkanesulfonate monooxygenase SsuD/methylene tetrahydromethanopterin reductase-like flavin-dependent oxidoreductase (luciferase family)|nr:LLM class flavin-dependent oxidoreductase [Thermoanaerobaculia bacterium]